MTQPLIIALGASAGGIQALQQFFEHTHAETGLAYVVLLHLSPNHDSQLARVLQQVTKMPVSQVLSKTRIEENHVYVIPPDKHLTMENGHIVPSQNILLEERRAPVDIFFRSLAEVHERRAVGVILSGTGANGSMGLKRIKECGGAVFVQNPREAEFNEMPRNAIATDLVDDVLNVAEIPGRILMYRDTLQEAHIEEEPTNRVEEDQRALRDIFSQLRTRTGHDFSNYKRATLMRRIERRMAVKGISVLPEYTAYSQQHPDETQALLKDLLISVTNFFRDKTPFEALEADVMPRIFQDRSGDDQIRIWVAGCATGEEAYTIAMLCAERTWDNPDAPKVQIFATDIDESAIAAGRDGLYSLNDAADISVERLNRFFVRENDGYRIRREIRESILFANHNFLKDPPFSRIDLISCRNVLIYLNRPAQERVLETFHFALKPGGFMLLGTSESVDTANDLFSNHNREQNIYQSRSGVLNRSFVIPETAPQLRYNQPAKRPVEPSGLAIRLPSSEVHLQLIEQFAPPSIVVNANFDIVHASQRASRYLNWASGEPTHSLFKLIRDELRADVRNGLYQAVQKGTPVVSSVLRLRTETHTEDLVIRVRPGGGESDALKGYLLVLFEPATGAEQHGEVISQMTDESATRQLEDELASLRAQLRAGNEQHEFQAEEMKAGNEELQAMNEELRSATEELETSKEELQSINEELSTVNQELKVKVEEATMISNNLQNLINSTGIGTLFLDRSFRVVLFTPAVRSVLNLIAADHGRPLTDITSRLDTDKLLEDADMVLQKLLTLEQEAQTNDGRTLLLRLSPYRTEEDRIQGVVISFFDISERKANETALMQSQERLALIASVSGFGIHDYTLDSGRFYWSRELNALVGAPPDAELSLEQVLATVHPDDRSRVERELKGMLLTDRKGEFENEFRILRQDTGELRWLYNRSRTIFEGSGPARKPVRNAGIVIDITQRKQTEDALRESEEQLSIAMESAIDYAIITMDPERRILGWSRGAERAFEYTEQEMIGELADVIFTPEDRAAGIPRLETQMARDEGMAPDERWHMRKDGTRFFMNGVVRPIYHALGMIGGYVKVARDMTSQKEAEETLRLSEERYRAALASAEMAAWDWNVAEDRIVWNDQHFLILGLKPVEGEIDSSYFLKFIYPEDVDLVTKALRIATDDTGIYQAEFRIVRADSREIRWMSGHGSAVVIDDHGHALRMVGVMHDVTSQKRAEEQKEEFIGIASHELKTPLASIKAYSQVLHEIFVEEGNAQSVKLMGKMEAQIDRLTNLVRALLDVTQIRGGKLELQKETIALDELVRESVEEMQLTTPIKLNISETTRVDVQADRKGVVQIFVNLLSNAIKYARATKHIDIRIRIDQTEAVVSVQDYGIGMTKEIAAHVFERFYRGQGGAVGTYPGLGLGLYISAEIVRMHGGRIWVESEPGKGSLFSFSLPLS